MVLACSFLPSFHTSAFWLLSTMTKPKKWYLESFENKVVIKESDGECIRKPNAKQPLGKVVKALVSDGDMLQQLPPSKAILVSFLSTMEQFSLYCT